MHGLPKKIGSFWMLRSPGRTVRPGRGRGVLGLAGHSFLPPALKSAAGGIPDRDLQGAPQIHPAGRFAMTQHMTGSTKDGRPTPADIHAAFGWSMSGGKKNVGMGEGKTP